MDHPYRQKLGGWVCFVSPALGKSGRTLFPAWSYVLSGWSVIAMAFFFAPSIRLQIVNTALGLVFIMMGHQIEVSDLLCRVEKLESHGLGQAPAMKQSGRTGESL